MFHQGWRKRDLSSSVAEIPRKRFFLSSAWTNLCILFVSNGCLTIFRVAIKSSPLHESSSGLSVSSVDWKAINFQSLTKHLLFRTFLTHNECDDNIRSDFHEMFGKWDWTEFGRDRQKVFQNVHRALWLSTTYLGTPKRTERPQWLMLTPVTSPTLFPAENLCFHKKWKLKVAWNLFENYVKNCSSCTRRIPARFRFSRGNQAPWW